ncbi:helicase RepA family protein [Streptomyces massasporeus]|uniref:helicase RepA family protein n=1 Tax=Streptomyces massasporeus TaxID=67324 RepID=UPI0016733692|nr:helicase RepA family protein [Streptomyces massasporeus]GGV64507.1 hypothetical protein GCM10010228_15240 [Streptomyces massasporeus]
MINWIPNNTAPRPSLAFTDPPAYNRISFLADHAAMLTEEGQAKVRASVELAHLAAFDEALRIATDKATEGTYGKLVRALVDASDVDLLPDPEPLIDAILDRDTLVWMYGPPASYKSFLALHMSGCVVTGDRFCGHAVMRTGTVLYLCAEGKRGLKKRVKAWERHHGKTMKGVKFLPVAVQLLDDEQVDALVRLCGETGPVLVVIDTQSRCTVGMDENSNGQMGQLVDAADRIRKATGACVLLLHHTGRDGKGLRGASAMDGAADAMIKVEADKGAGAVTMSSGKQKDSAEFPPITLRVQVEAESLILSHEPVRISTGGEGEVLRVLTECFTTAAASPSKIIELADASKATVYRALESLVAKGAVINSGSKTRPQYSLAQGQDQIPNSHSSN